MTTSTHLAMDALYAAWLAAPHKTATLRAVTEHFRDQLPEGTGLGKPCRKHGHTWNGTPWCIRKHSHCAICQPVQQLLDPDERRQRNIDRKRRHRQRLIAHGLSSRDGTPRKVLRLTPLHRAIRTAGRCPTVAKLVDAEQRAYWRKNPDAYRVEQARLARHRWRLKYLTDEDLRRYNREKARRRKALERGNHVIRVTSSQVCQRFQQFDHFCAYCGQSAPLQIEHFIPISRGGTHVLSNILPACQPCNYAKRDHDPETWYRSQQFFTEQRWRAILRVLGKQRVPVGQLSLV